MEDLTKVRVINCGERFWAGYEQKIRRMLNSSINNVNYRKDNSTYVIIEVENTIVGFISVVPINGIDFIKNLYVNPDFRGKGIGKFLIKKAINIGNNNIKFALTTVLNTASKAVFKSVGFRQIELSNLLSYNRNIFVCMMLILSRQKDPNNSTMKND